MLSAVPVIEVARRCASYAPEADAASSRPEHLGWPGSTWNAGDCRSESGSPECQLRPEA